MAKQQPEVDRSLLSLTNSQGPSLSLGKKKKDCSCRGSLKLSWYCQTKGRPPQGMPHKPVSHISCSADIPCMCRIYIHIKLSFCLEAGGLCPAGTGRNKPFLAAKTNYNEACFASSPSSHGPVSQANGNWMHLWNSAVRLHCLRLSMQPCSLW